MMTVMMLLLVAGAVAILVGNVMVIVAAFRVHWGWGLACMLLAPLSLLAFAVAKWDKAQNGIYYTLFGVGLVVLSGFDFKTVSYNFSKHQQMYNQYYYQTMDAVGILSRQPTATYACVNITGGITYQDKPCDSTEGREGSSSVQQESSEIAPSLKIN